MGFEPVDLGHPDANRAVNVLRAQLDDTPSVWWWLSFVDPARPEGDRFVGVAIVRASNIVTAAMEAHRLGCNPGGELAGIEIPDEHVPAPEWRERLLTRADVERMEAAP